MKKTMLFAAACLIPLAACTTANQDEGVPAPHLGEAVKRNIAAQVVNPDAPLADEGPQTMDGRRAALAQERYATGKVVQPEDTSVTQLQQNNGSNGGGGTGSTMP